MLLVVTVPVDHAIRRLIQKKKREETPINLKRKLIYKDISSLKKMKWSSFNDCVLQLNEFVYVLVYPQQLTSTPGGGTWVFFGWVCAARDSKLAPRSKKNSP